MKQRYVSMLLASFITVGASVPLAAVIAPAESDQTITVTGERLEKSEARKRASEFIRVTTATRMDQYTRRALPICPRAIGIDPAYAEIVTQKIRTIAKTAGIDQASSVCEGNLFILFTDNANGLMTILRKEKPGLFADVPTSEKEELYAGNSPIRWWHTNQLFNDEGGSIVSGTLANGVEETRVDFRSSSSIATAISISLANSVVVVDVNQSKGYPLESIAAYAAMVSLAQIAPDRGFSRLPSILSLFSKAANSSKVQRDLTPLDQAYLKSLYEGAINRERYVQKSVIAGRMANRLAVPGR